MKDDKVLNLSDCRVGCEMKELYITLLHNENISDEMSKKNLAIVGELFGSSMQKLIKNNEV